MAWWLALLVSLVGATGGVAGGYLSGRLGSRATLRAVREERAARSRVDYAAALLAYRHAAGLLAIKATEVPPARRPTRVDKWTFLYPMKVLGRVFAIFMSERDSTLLLRRSLNCRSAARCLDRPSL